MIVFRVLLLLVSLVQLSCFNVNRQAYKKGLVRPSQVDDEIYHDFHGPMGSFADIEGACTLTDIGLTLLVGKSTINSDMKGLFITINEDTDDVFIPKASVVCGYAKGTFTTSFTGDKTVGYRFINANNIIVFEKQIMPLIDCITIISQRTNDLSNCIAGHTLNENNDIETMTNYQLNYFVPDNICDYSVGRLGLYANDFNINDSSTSENNYYTAESVNYFARRKKMKSTKSSSKNILNLVWRMEWQESTKQIVPTWPVLVTNKNLRFSNVEPMEVGLDYGRQYWQEYLGK